MSNSFVCKDCSTSFTIKPDILAKYPGWTPRQCMKCKNKSGKGAKASSKAKGRSSSRRGVRRKAPEENLTRAQVLERYTEGPLEGVFTDGACKGNPGPGGWGMVHVVDNQPVEEQHGKAAHTTNNRMEWQALIAALDYLPPDANVTIYSDSNLCVKSLNEWAAGWKRRGWKRKTGPVENLELVQQAYELKQRHPKVKVQWIKAHNGSRWNEYADALATKFMRP